MMKQKEEVVFFVDNCPAHPHIGTYMIVGRKTKKLKAGSLPPNSNRLTRALSKVFRCITESGFLQNLFAAGKW